MCLIFGKGVWCRTSISVDVVCKFCCLNWICTCVLIADEPKVCPIGLLVRIKTCEKGLGVCVLRFKHHILSDQYFEQITLLLPSFLKLTVLKLLLMNSDDTYILMI